ncbi:MAG: Malonyl CoA-acyl carrier protein transacylase [Candidatus Ozemobacter sibiricus]|uniref:Malonyl CoA-acyl carrier protein transacylase n=1 Tax=Candidatus Ozemobacter sibiricus TaxID=2268124 RepID=A0A367ZTQ5_9BACT|nr:MAG: Malonyl CoA-acyl carrier protein transacylase [Candidatus Ozemobacter sibiricus]
MNVLIFPGQGSQKVGMAKAMVEAWPWAAELAARTDRILGRPLSTVCFEGPESALKETTTTQPAIFFTAALLVEALRRQQFLFGAAAGHSLGEYAALYAAGVASYDDLLRLVDERARAMETACPSGTGAMAAVMMLSREALEAVCQEASALGVCVVANENCPGQLVISGARAAVARAGELATQKGAKRVIPLEVSGPFHSPLMGPARDRLAAMLETIPFADARVPVYTNVDGRPTTAAADLKRKLLDQLTGSVRWETSVHQMWKDGFRTFIELGASKVVGPLVKKTVAEATIAYAGDPATVQALVAPAATVSA